MNKLIYLSILVVGIYVLVNKEVERDFDLMALNNRDRVNYVFSLDPTVCIFSCDWKLYPSNDDYVSWLVANDYWRSDTKRNPIWIQASSSREFHQKLFNGIVDVQEFTKNNSKIAGTVWVVYLEYLRRGKTIGNSTILRLANGCDSEEAFKSLLKRDLDDVEIISDLL